MSEPRENHLQAACQVLSDLKNTIDQGLLFTWNENLSVEFYTDANYTSSAVNRRSTAGFLAFVGGSLIPRCSQKQKMWQDPPQRLSSMPWLMVYLKFYAIQLPSWE